MGMIGDVSREEGKPAKTPLCALSNPENLEGRWSTLASSTGWSRLIRKGKVALEVARRSLGDI